MVVDDEKRKNVSELSVLFGFTDADLNLNREGMLSQKQQGRLRSNLLMMSVVYGLLLSFQAFLALMALLMIGLTLGLSNGGSSALTSLCGGVVLLGVVARFIPGTVRDWWRYWRESQADLRAEAISEVTGPIRKFTEQAGKSGKVTYTKIALEDLTFHVSSAAYDYLMEGGLYKLYYTPHTRLLLTIENAPDDFAEVMFDDEDKRKTSEG